MSYFPFSWPMALLAVAIVLLIGILIAWSVSALERRNRDEARAEQIQTVVGHAIARELGPGQAAILPVAGFPAEVVDRLDVVPPLANRRRA